MDKLWIVLEILIEGIYDALEEFVASINAPSTKFTLHAFFYALGFLALSIVLQILGLSSFVSWQEATTCVVLMLIIVLIDGSVRSDIKSVASKVKTTAGNLSNRNNVVSIEEQQEDYDAEVFDDGSGE